MSVVNAIPLIAAGDDGYSISRSLRFRSSASAYLNRTFGSAGNRKTFTLSMWLKRGALSAASTPSIISATSNASTDDQSLRFTSADQLEFSYWNTTYQWRIITNNVLRDVAAWYHLVVKVDTTQAVAADRIRLYLNNVEVSYSSASYPAQNATLNFGNAQTHYLGSDISFGYLDAYFTEVNFIDGQALTPSSFGETDAVTGVWKPKKYAGTYGTNGFYLNFSDNSSNTATTIGKDYSGNGNNWTPNNISVTAGVTYDSMLDVPTPYADGGNGRGNYAVLNPLSNGGATISNANLTATANGATHYITNSTFQIPTSGKWYWEVTSASLASGSRIAAGLLPNGTALSGYAFGNANTYGWYYGDASNNIYWCSNGSQPFFVSGTSGDVLQFCYDADNGNLYTGKNNVFYNSAGATTGSPSTLTNPTSSSVSASNAFFPATSVFSSGAFNANFGQRPFTYTPPTGFVALNTQNLPESTIKKGNQYFDVSTWTGDQTSRTITNSGAFQPDFIWTKSRSDAESHRLHDAVRGGNGSVLYELNSNETSAEGTDTLVSGFASNGFTIASGANSPNVTGRTYVGWQWKEGATQGFDIVTYTGNGGTQNISHNLGVAPRMMIVKKRSTTGNWPVYHASLGNATSPFLNLTNAANSQPNLWNSTTPTSSVFTVGSDAETNANTATFVAYLFSEVAGFSRMGSYTGNGSTDGPFVFLGFRPRFVMVKRTDAAGYSWTILDSSRDTYNVETSILYPNLSNAENTGSARADFLSNGFKPRDSSNDNVSGGTYIFAAFSEVGFKYALGR